VLIAEDNMMISAVLSKLLKKQGILHDVAPNGEEAVKRWTQGDSNYHIILMDIQMPIMDGLTAVKAIREHERSLMRERRAKIIFMSANATVEEIAQTKNIGGDHYLTKPVEFAVLLKLMKEMLSS
jgi:CheY-like chemotaxis protein